MKITGYKRYHFGDWLITITILQGCLYCVMAYNVSRDYSVILDKTWAIENDAMKAITDRLRLMAIGTVHEQTKVMK